MAQYADYAFYTDSFFGDTLTAENANKWLTLASDELDTLTFGRLTFAFPTVEAHAEKVKKAVCAVAEALFNIDYQHKAVTAQKAEDGTYKGPIASVSSGRESISYASPAANASVYAAAAANYAEQNKLIGSIVAKYIANIPDANGINLLYAGEVRNVRQNNHSV